MVHDVITLDTHRGQLFVGLGLQECHLTHPARIRTRCDQTVPMTANGALMVGTLLCEIVLL